MIKIDPKKLRIMVKEIIFLERDNLKNARLSEAQITEEIIKIIKRNAK